MQINQKMKNHYRLEKVDHINFTKEDWNRYFDFRTKSYALNNEPMPFNSLEELRKLNVTNITESGDEIYQVWKNEIENGILVFSVVFKDDSKKRYTYLENYMNDKYLEENLLEMFFKQFLDYDEKSNFLLIYSKDGMNDYVKERFSAKFASNEECYELTIQEANMDKIDAWLEEALIKFPNFGIAFYNGIPDNLLEEYAALYTQMLEDMPGTSGLLDTKVTAESTKALQEGFKLRNYGIYSYLIFNEDNQIIALTCLNVNLKDPKELNQSITGVKEEYRGRGIGKWLKAAMFKKILADFPELEKIETETHPENHPSRELSKQMGYKRTGIEKEFSIGRDYIVDYVKG